MAWLERRLEMRRLRKRWLREYRGGAVVILGQIDPDYIPPSTNVGGAVPDERLKATSDAYNRLANQLYLIRLAAAEDADPARVMAAINALDPMESA